MMTLKKLAKKMLRYKELINDNLDFILHSLRQMKALITGARRLTKQQAKMSTCKGFIHIDSHI